MEFVGFNISHDPLVQRLRILGKKIKEIEEKSRHNQQDKVSNIYFMLYLIIYLFVDAYLATPLYFDTPLEKPLLFLQNEHIKAHESSTM